MIWKWFPWRYVIRNAARRQGFIDPIKLLSQVQNFAQPSEVAAPTELLRSGVVLHARGLMNSLAIQHNLDWIWPYWVERQFDPHDESFIPRSFSLTQINLTHRNWTAVGIPGSTEYPLVDPRGLVTPCYDGWSLDAWIIGGDGRRLIPSRLPAAEQKLEIEGNLCIRTECRLDQFQIISNVRMSGTPESPVCRMQFEGTSPVNGWLVISLRPYNPEGVSFINEISLLEGRKGWQVDLKKFVYLDKPPDQFEFSFYNNGDVYSQIPSVEDKQSVKCSVGMASAAALYKLEAGIPKEIIVEVPLAKDATGGAGLAGLQAAQTAWEQEMRGKCSLKVPDRHFQFLYDAAVRTMALHCPKEVYPGPYTYRRFWFRDAAIILYSMLCVGFRDRVSRALDCFRSRQTVQGYFLSQEGEWDSNGEALWIMAQYCRMTGEAPPTQWKASVERAGQWICRKLLPKDLKADHAGLLPAGFSAEHLGPNDFYYWDDFWGVAGLRSAAFLCTAYKNNALAVRFEDEAGRLSQSIEHSLAKAAGRLKRPAMPASPYRRMDSGAVGSLAAGYPLHLFEEKDPRTLGTADFLMENCLVNGGFFHDMTHSGINPYLTLHLAQVYLRAGDARYFELMKVVADIASPTGQWPEAVHPHTGGGCMGDGQHVWAAAEWVLMIRNCFVREEGNRLILCSGIPQKWFEAGTEMFFGPAQTAFGEISITIKPGPKPVVEYSGKWLGPQPEIEVRLR